MTTPKSSNTSRDSVYEFAKLDPSNHDIRLLSISSQLIDNQVLCSLKVVSLNDENLQYHALSYAWGEVNDTAGVLIDTHAGDQGSLVQLSVPKSLENALRQLRSHEDVQYLWADSLCINQTNDNERSSQVYIMDCIYESAVKTIIWLGAGEEDEDRAMRLIHEIATNGMPESLAEIDHRAWNALPTVLRCPWWKRLWVVQEQVKSRADPSVICGETQLSWSDFVAFQRIIEAYDRTQLTSDDDEWRSHLEPKTRNNVAHFQLLRSRKAHELTIDKLLVLTCDHSKTEARDGLYALRGLLPPGARTNWELDYSKPVLFVYAEFVANTVDLYGRLEIICLRKPRILTDLPSWVPDFSSSVDIKRIYALDFLTPGKANGDIPPQVSFSTDLRKLTMEGLYFDTIQTTVGPLVDGKVQEMLEECESSVQQADLTSRILEHPYAALDRSTPLCEVLLANWREYDKDAHDMYEVFLQRASVPEDFAQLHRPESGCTDHEAHMRLDYILPLIEAFAHSLPDHVMIITNQGFLGTAPPETQKGDRIIVAFGCGMPLVVRPDGDENVLVGSCRVPAIMEGQWVETHRDADESVSSTQYVIH